VSDGKPTTESHMQEDDRGETRTADSSNSTPAASVMPQLNCAMADDHSVNNDSSVAASNAPQPPAVATDASSVTPSSAGDGKTDVDGDEDNPELTLLVVLQ